MFCAILPGSPIEKDARPKWVNDGKYMSYKKLVRPKTQMCVQVT